MARLAVSLAAMLLFSDHTNAQQFSTEPNYVDFYKLHFNAEFESTREPTIALWWITEQFGVPKVPREKLRDLLTTHAKLFPDPIRGGRVACHLKIVERMLAEKRPPDEKKIEQLIFDLRDLNMRQWHQPNRGLRIVGQGALRFDDLLGNRNPNPDAVQQLCDIGYDAIPILIDHIDDDTLTRSVDFWRNFTFSHRVLTVGDCCRQIIDAILPTGREFDFASDPETAKLAMKNHYKYLIAQKRAEPSHAPNPGLQGSTNGSSTVPAR